MTSASATDQLVVYLYAIMSQLWSDCKPAVCYWTYVDIEYVVLVHLDTDSDGQKAVKRHRWGSSAFVHPAGAVLLT